jgi:predicted ATPase
MGSLNRIEVSGFTSIKRMDLNLRPLNVLIGANGAGKSNFIALFNLLNHLVEGRLEVFVGQAGGTEPFLYFGERVTKEITIRLTFGQNGYETKLIPSKRNTLVFAEEMIWFQGAGYAKPFTIGLGSGHSETELTNSLQGSSSAKIARHVIDNLQSWKVYHFHDTSDEAAVKKICDINDNSMLRANASNLAAFLHLLQAKHPQHYARIIGTIRMVAPFFHDFVLRPSELNPNKIRLEWKQKGSDSYLDAYSLSDGTLRFICLVTLLLQPRLPSTILIDEPELGLHPYAITTLAGLLQGASKRTQVIVSTQSVPLVNQFLPEDLIVVEREDSQSTFNYLPAHDMEHWLEEYGLGDLWEKNVIGGRPQ